MPMKNPNHPGDIIKRDFMEASNLTEEQLSKMTGIPQNTLHNILEGAAPVTQEIADKLENVRCSNAVLLMRIQASYDCAQS